MHGCIEEEKVGKKMGIIMRVVEEKKSLLKCIINEGGLKIVQQNSPLL